MMSMCIEPNLQPIITRESLMSVSGASTITEDGNYQVGCCHMVRINHTTSPPATEKQEMNTNKDFWKPLAMSSLEAWGVLLLSATKGLPLWSPPNWTSLPVTSLDAACHFHLHALFNAVHKGCSLCRPCYLWYPQKPGSHNLNLPLPFLHFWKLFCFLSFL